LAELWLNDGGMRAARLERILVTQGNKRRGVLGAVARHGGDGGLELCELLGGERRQLGVSSVDAACGSLSLPEHVDVLERLRADALIGVAGVSEFARLGNGAVDSELADGWHGGVEDGEHELGLGMGGYVVAHALAAAGAREADA
jgi:hypothetical protein